MLKPSGALAICIDYRELFHLGKMCDEIFGNVSLPHSESGHNQGSSQEIHARIGYDLGGICLDPFAGTGTTGEVILQFNKELKTEKERAKSTDSTKFLSNNKHEWQFILIEQGFNPKEEDEKEKN
ncbi:9130_t:CDS:2 [Ambispora gerdemannii]|uniref:9130_t:CDS:1 n=1 Tax=Ambispora gerdemannii TaxID=144530 RepID=A0A9N9CIY4_9GLOM|nr:9130_t:CDS:2 [Ambispora gerdemannii]